MSAYVCTLASRCIFILLSNKPNCDWQETRYAYTTDTARQAKPQDIGLNCLLTKLLASDLFINANNNHLRLIIQINDLLRGGCVCSRFDFDYNHKEFR